MIVQKITEASVQRLKICPCKLFVNFHTKTTFAFITQNFYVNSRRITQTQVRWQWALFQLTVYSNTTGDAVESVTFSLTLCMRSRTILSCVSINYFFVAFLAYFVIDALRFHNTADKIAKRDYSPVWPPLPDLSEGVIPWTIFVIFGGWVAGWPGYNMV